MRFDRPCKRRNHSRTAQEDYSRGRRKAHAGGVESAVEDFQKYVLARKLSGKKLFQQADEWFLEKDRDELFSFKSICETLQLHPD
jgi:flagellar biosynthesis/type III secretory pathway protein FliH